MSERTTPEQGARSQRSSMGLLRDPGTIRLRCAAILRAVDDGRSPWWRLDRSRLDAAAERVAALTLERFPDLKIPYHSRWRHFEAGGVDRKAELDALMQQHSAADAARARIDLTVVSVLLDAGAGAAWTYRDRDGGRYARSEGLALASLRAFSAGTFSTRPGEALRCDGEALARIDAAALREIFQVGADNPMVGLEGRAAMLARLGRALVAQPDAAARRPGILYDRLSAEGTRRSVSASAVLQEVLELTEAVFTTGTPVMGRTAGDAWSHRWAGSAVVDGRTDPVTAGIVPFHKLGQWLSYSLLEPLQWAGIEVEGLDALTGLPEYRNGGLLIDSGVIVPRNPRLFERLFTPGEEAIVEWRALTVVLLDELAVRVRERLARSAAELPLACILEGGTWAAGRVIAAEMREDGAPPLRIDSDGTVF